MSQLILSHAMVTPPTEVLTPDADGYYRLRAGGFNAKNSYDEYYIWNENTQRLFNGGATAIKDIKDGKLYGELDHPKREAGMSNEDWLKRNFEINDDQTAIHIKDIINVSTEVAGDIPDTKLVRTDCLITPFGLKKDVAEDSLKNKNINTALSLRNLYRIRVVNGLRIRELLDIITYDFVKSNGLPGSDKFTTIQTVGQDCAMDSDVVLRTLDEMRESAIKIGHDSEIARYDSIERNIRICSNGRGGCLYDW